MEGLVCPEHDGWMERVFLNAEGKICCGKAVAPNEAGAQVGGRPACGKVLITEEEYNRQ